MSILSKTLLKLTVINVALLASTYAAGSLLQVQPVRGTTVQTVFVTTSDDLRFPPLAGAPSVLTTATYCAKETTTPLNRGLTPNTPETAEEWRQALDFLHTVLSSMYHYDEHGKLSTDGSITTHPDCDEFLSRVVEMQAALNTVGYIPERSLHTLYTNIVQRRSAPQYARSDLSRNLYTPLKQWMEDHLPISPICKAMKITYDPKHTYCYICSIPDIYALFREHEHLSEASLTSRAKILIAQQLRKEIDDMIACEESSTEYERAPMIIRYTVAYTKLVQRLDTLIQQHPRGASQTTPVKHHPSNRELCDAERQAHLQKMLEEFGLKEDDPQKPGGKKPKPKAAAKSSASVPKPHQQRDTGTTAAEPTNQSKTPQAQTIQALSKAERQANLALAKAENAKRNAEQRRRQQMLDERRAAEDAAQATTAAALQQRAQTALEKMFNSHQALQNPGTIDPSIFDGSPDLEGVVIPALAQAGVSVHLHIHGNEACVAMWKDAGGKKHMNWFHYPHGTDKGEDFGWVRGLEKDLRETGMLAPKTQ